MCACTGCVAPVLTAWITKNKVCTWTNATWTGECGGLHMSGSSWNVYKTVWTDVTVIRWSRDVLYSTNLRQVIRYMSDEVENYLFSTIDSLRLSIFVSHLREWVLLQGASPIFLQIFFSRLSATDMSLWKPQARIHLIKGTHLPRLSWKYSSWSMKPNTYKISKGMHPQRIKTYNHLLSHLVCKLECAHRKSIGLLG